MFKEIRNKPQALLWAILLHVVIVLVLLLSFKLTDRPSTTSDNVPVQVVTPDGETTEKPTEDEAARTGLTAKEQDASPQQPDKQEASAEQARQQQEAERKAEAERQQQEAEQ